MSHVKKKFFLICLYDDILRLHGFFLTCFDVHFISNQLATCILYMREYVCVCAPLAVAGLPMIPCSGAEAELWFCGGCDEV